MSSACGSADVLEELGFALEQPPERIAESIDRLGFGFMFAPSHHPAMRHAAPVRRELGTRTIFNVLGPLTNPAGRARGRLRRLLAVARADDRRGARAARDAPRVRRPRLRRDRRALAVRAEPGRPRSSTATSATASIDPAELGIEPSDPASLTGGSAEENAARDPRGSWRASERGPKRDAVVLNAAGGIAAAGLARRPARRARASRGRARLRRGGGAARASSWRSRGRST